MYSVEQRRTHIEQLTALYEESRWLFLTVARQTLKQHLQREIEDVVQDAFVEALSQAELFRGEASLKTWLLVVLVRTAWRRNRKKEPVLSRYAQLQDYTITESLDFHAKLENQQLLKQLMRDLTKEQRVFLQRWMAEEFQGQMEQNYTRNTFRRSKLKMRSSAKEQGIIQDAA